MYTIKNKAGVYRIVNTENGKVYYGSSQELRQRWTEHKSMMRLGTHKNPGMREDAAIHGEEAFEFQVLCYCKPEERKRLEAVYIDQNLGEECYNRADGDGSYEFSEEHKAKISENHARHWEGKTLSEEHKAKMSATRKGKTHTEETKARISAAQKGKKQPLVTCPHCGLAGGNNAMQRWHFANCKHKEVHNV